MAALQRITPCLWFDHQAEDAARFYTSIFPDSRIGAIARYGEAGHEFHGKPPGSVMTVAFELDGHSLTALNGGPLFRFNEAVSLQVNCDTQAEVDHYWNALAAGADPQAQQCGWLKDRFGLSWQIVPRAMSRWMAGGSAQQAQRVMSALLQMKKLDVAALDRAFAGP
jgi:predicted 3-demethylubiquinone-9 3-methyltransferase (glyoxalase superfamily)